ncbi:MAG TPA: hypothetical protein VGQ62_24260 [Chloroflexota bacterium]|nr:hypothetical protein [Chloroflexota bacterium]
MWRRRAALGVLGVAVVVSVARVTLLVGPGEVPPGREIEPLLGQLRAAIPPDAGYLLVLPGEFGTDTGVAPRLRYELFPRRYDDVRASVDEGTIRQLMSREGLRFVVVPDAAQYDATSWLRQPRDWLRRAPLDGNETSYVLEVIG